MERPGEGLSNCPIPVHPLSSLQTSVTATVSGTMPPCPQGAQGLGAEILVSGAEPGSDAQLQHFRAVCLWVGL